MTSNQQLGVAADRAARAFVAGLTYRGPRAEAIGDSFYLHGAEIVRRITHEGKPALRFCRQGWDTMVTVTRQNMVAKLVFGQIIFRRKKGKVFFGPGLLREVTAHEHFILHMDWKPESSGVRRPQRFEELPAGVT